MNSGPLTFELDGRTLRFATPDDFAFSLSGRTQLAAASVTDLIRLSPSELRREAATIRDAERCFVDLLADALKAPGSVGELLGGIDTGFIAEENQWRAIMAALIAEDPGFDEYKHLALVKYTQFLAARRDIVRSIYAQRFGARVPLTTQEPAGSGGAKSTLLIEDEPGPDTESSRNHFQRLPRGETVSVRAPVDGGLSILLSRHKFQLFAADTRRLTDDQGIDYPLKAGLNVIGRHPGNDVVVGGWYRDVSRKHLMVDARGDGLKLTDLSTHGTFLPGRLLGNVDEC